MFFHDPGASRPNDIHARRLVIRLLRALDNSCGYRARHGIRPGEGQPTGLRESHREACDALLESDETVAFYRAAYHNGALRRSQNVCSRPITARRP